jgi:hypothetical protein
MLQVQKDRVLLNITTNNSRLICRFVREFFLPVRTLLSALKLFFWIFETSLYILCYWLVFTIPLSNSKTPKITTGFRYPLLQLILVLFKLFLPQVKPFLVLYKLISLDLSLHFILSQLTELYQEVDFKGLSP